MSSIASHFSSDDLNAWQRMLEAEAAQLRIAITQDRHELDGVAGVLPPAFDDGRDEPTVDVMRDVDVAELQRRADQLASVEAALGRIADGTFGLCIQCGDAISLLRLKASPSSARCMLCQTNAERGLKHASSL